MVSEDLNEITDVRVEKVELIWPLAQAPSMASFMHVPDVLALPMDPEAVPHLAELLDKIIEEMGDLT